LNRAKIQKLLLGAVVLVCLAQAASAASLMVAASDSSSTVKSQADFVCDGAADQSEIQAALNKLASGGSVVLAKGTFNIQGIISMPAGTTLTGQGADSTFLKFTNDGRINVDKEYVTLDGFHMSGKGYSSGVKWLGVLNIRASHAKIHNISGTADTTIQAVFLLIHDPTVYSPTLEDVEFVNCHVKDTGTYGFLHNAWGTTNKTIKNVRYEGCSAVGCGKLGWFNPWITGFDFAELNDIQGLRVNNCYAAENLESGFHFEWDPTKTDCILTNCVSENNGQKAYPTTATYQDYFGCGYYAPRGDVTFENCVSDGNSRNGFFVTNGAKLYDCVDKNVGAGKSDYSIIKPASYYGIPTRSANPSLVLENCSSIDANGYGLHIDLANYVQIKNFKLVNPAGINGRGTNLGGDHGQFDNSVVNIYASGDRAQTLIYAKENENVVFSGQIVSNSAKPFVIDGYGTKNVKVQNMEIVSQTLTPGSTGVTLTSSVPSSAVSFDNCVVTKDGSAVVIPTPTTTPTPTPTPSPTLERADLVVTGIATSPASPAPGDQVTLQATVKNQGTGATPAGVITGVLFRIDEGTDTYKGVWSDSYTKAIAAGETVTLTANGGSSGYTWTAAEGSHTVRATVDDVNRITESNENNNEFSTTFTVTTNPVPTPTPTPFPDGQVVSFTEDFRSLSSGESAEFTLQLNDAPTGLAGYYLTVAVSDPAVAEISGVSFPDWAILNSASGMPAESVTLRATDLDSAINAGDTDVVLGTVEVTGKSAGTASLTVTVTKMDADGGLSITPAAIPASVTVASLVPLPGLTAVPADIDGCGYCEDLNGNGRVDFDDVVLFYRNMDWIQTNEPVDLFDFNGNGRIDYDDIVVLHHRV
jgi:PKD repeat protein